MMIIACQFHANRSIHTPKGTNSPFSFSLNVNFTKFKGFSIYGRFKNRFKIFRCPCLDCIFHWRDLCIHSIHVFDSIHSYGDHACLPQEDSKRGRPVSIRYLCVWRAIGISFDDTFGSSHVRRMGNTNSRKLSFQCDSR